MHAILFSQRRRHGCVLLFGRWWGTLEHYRSEHGFIAESEACVDDRNEMLVESLPWRDKTVRQVYHECLRWMGKIQPHVQ